MLLGAVLAFVRCCILGSQTNPYLDSVLLMLRLYITSQACDSYP